MKTSLRDYQEDSVRLINLALNAGSNPLCVLPTGGGKSLVLAELIRLRKQRVLVLSHLRELLDQDSRALRSLAPDIPQSFYSAGLREKRGGSEVVFGSVQTVVRSLTALGPRSLILIDEAHLCPRSSDAMYARVFAHFSLAQRAGFTATPKRLDSGSLIGGDDAWFDCVAHEIPASELIKRGYLLPLTGVLAEHQADLAGVGTRMGEFAADQAQEAVSRTLALTEVVADILRLASKREHILIFAAGVEHAEKVVNELKLRRVGASLVVADTPAEERDMLVAKFREGDLRVLVNVGVLTTGFDAPQTDCIVALRPTKSDVLWQQMLGRGMRLSESKRDCLLLDFVGNLERLGGVGCVQAVEDRRGLQTASPRNRPVTEKEFNDKQIEYNEASLADPMKTRGPFAARVNHFRIFISSSRRFPGKRMVIAVYDLEDELGRAVQARSFVCVEFPGSGRYHAVQWFMRRGVCDSEQVPRDSLTALALAKVAPVPTEVTAYWDPGMKSYLVSEERF